MLQRFKLGRRAGLLFVGVAILGCSILASNSRQSFARQPIPSNAQTTLTVTVDFPDGSSITVPGVPAPTACRPNVRLAMLNANYLNPKLTFQTTFYYPYGDYVTEINGWHGGGGRYWALYVNGTAASCGINSTLLNAGDTVTWKLVSTTEKSHDEKSFQAKIHKMRSAKLAE